MPCPILAITLPLIQPSQNVDLSVADKGVLAFGRFRLDPQRRVLMHDDGAVKLTPKAFDTLLYLVANAGRLVEKDELLSAVWGARIVEEGNLSQTIFSIRKALQAEPGADRWIVTAPGRGYRFTAEVLREASGVFRPASPALVSEPTPLQPIMPAKPAGRPRRRFVWGSLAVVLGLAAFASWLAMHRQGPMPARPAVFAPPPHSVAVLAFSNMSGDAAQDYFSDGLADELINTLGRIDTLRVAARTSAFSFKGGHATIDDIARKLNVGAVLEGSVLREAGQVRVNVQLVNAATGFPFWSRTYAQGLSNIFVTEAEIAGAVADSLRVTLLGDDAARLVAGGTRNPQAMDAYLRGLHYFHGTEGGRVEVAAFDSAIALDPNFAMARTMRSKALRDVVNIDGVGDAATMERLDEEAIAEAERAVALAPQLGAAHAALGGALEESRFDFSRALKELARGRELAPSDVETGQSYAEMQSNLGHAREAIETARLGVALDPLSPSRYMSLASILSKAGHNDDALIAARHMESVEGHATEFQRYLVGEIELEMGRPGEALKSCAAGSNWAIFHCQAIAYNKLGRQKEADAALASLHAALGDAGAMQYVTIYAQWGQADQAISWLQTAYRLHDSGLDEMKVLPLLDPIRGLAAFQDILHRMNFPP